MGTRCGRNRKLFKASRRACPCSRWWLKYATYQDVEGDVLKVDIHGREVVFEDDDYVHICLGAGENWHRLFYGLMQGLGGLENLSLIPGNCGTAPVQNIGAYGVELQDVFVSTTRV